MPVYRVFRKTDGEHVWGYAVDGPAIEWPDYPFALFDHVEYVDPPLPAGTVYGGQRVLTHLQFLSMFSADERVAIRAAGNSNAYIFDFLELMKLAQEIDLDDPRTQVGIQTLEQMGVIAAGRAAEVLHG